MLLMVEWGAIRQVPNGDLLLLDTSCATAQYGLPASAESGQMRCPRSRWRRDPPRILGGSSSSIGGRGTACRDKRGLEHQTPRLEPTIEPGKVDVGLRATGADLAE